MVCSNVPRSPRGHPRTHVAWHPLTCPAVVEFQGALDAEGLLTSAAPVPVLAVHLVKCSIVSAGGRAGGAPHQHAPPTSTLASSMCIRSTPLSAPLPCGLGT